MALPSGPASVAMVICMQVMAVRSFHFSQSLFWIVNTCLLKGQQEDQPSRRNPSSDGPDLQRDLWPLEGVATSRFAVVVPSFGSFETSVSTSRTSDAHS